MTRSAALGALLEGTIHLAITSAREFTKEIEYHPFSIDPIILIVPVDHPWAAQQQITPQDLLMGKFILREPEAGTRHAVKDGLANLGIHIDQLPTLMVLSCSEAIRTAVEERIGAAFISRSVASVGVQMGRIAEVKVAGLELQQHLYIGHSIQRPTTKAQLCFLEFFQAPVTSPPSNTNA
jgi:DNA-binding transcriptional LysR family regulator